MTAPATHSRALFRCRHVANCPASTDVSSSPESSRMRFEANDGGPLFPACDGPPHGARARPARSSHAHGPKLAVYSHIVCLSSDQIPPGPVERFIAVTREKYDGPLEIGEDLTTFEITASVRVKRGSPLSVDGPDLWPNSRRSLRMCGPFSARKQPSTTVSNGHASRVWLALRFRRGIS